MTRTARPARPKVTIELADSEQIVARGRRIVSHRVRWHDGWTAAKDYPGATVQKLECRPRMVWERIVSIELEIGALVERVETEPAPQARRDALAHLLEGPRAARRRTRRTLLVVGPRGELSRAGQNDGKSARDGLPARDRRRGR